MIFRDKIKDYTSDVLVRSESLLVQTESVKTAAKSHLNIGDSPCTNENILHLRVVVWPYPLIKDVGYIIKGELACSALWGSLRPTLSLEHFDKKWTSREGVWLFGIKLMDDISVNGYISEGIMVTLSPFVFRRFETDMYSKNFSAVVGNSKHDRHYFNIGPDAPLLDRHDSVPLRFRVFRACSLHYDLCVAGGGYFTGIFSEHWSIQMLLVTVSLLSGLMIYIIIMNRAELNSSLSARFVKALKNEALSLVYQPIYRIEDGQICGFEALLRWKDERLGNISPEVFIPLSEREGLQEDVTLFVINHAIREFIHTAIQNEIFLSVNINPSDLDSEKFRDKLLGLISEYNIPYKTILLEITERQGGDFEGMKIHIDKYKNHGVRFAIDDFGTGYSNLNLVTALDVDEIKIDKSLTSAIGTESLRYDLLPGLHEMFRSIADKIVFEGVETQEQVNYLKTFWPQSYAQGWYYSRALPLEEAKKLTIRELN
ncbi:TPA: EAL domain-containing protein [Klebsiella pneumoniae]|nr:EAL domain-containing protein [Klebsiella pneumoniae]HBQ3761092.1 EAL domain-containing protein [Klebsiella quasipneumoniae subsp. similipneumoniae]HBQ8671419.1 EAL domain-containing protein [Klebsiella pneumoniae]HBR1749220.1 EAL domain-containing protein [Klebsiella pneumoniae]HBR2736019.1 EAL domain-containing protein [Klebsiella pneumoniae]